MVPLIADVGADVVKQGAELEPLALTVGQRVNAPRLIENRQRQPRNLLRVFRPVAAALRELDDAAAPHIGVLAGLRDVFAVPLDVIQDEPFAQREVAQRNLARFEMAQHGVQQHGARDDQIGAPRMALD